jgi:fatty aldehyde-generating acyl-ACP reductase
VTSASVNKFACIGHPTDVEQFRAYVNALRAGNNSPVKAFKDKLLLKLFEWTPAFKIKDLQKVSFNGVEFASGIMVLAPFLPEMRDIKLKEIGEKIENAIGIASREGCSVAALGGFTSIILQGREEDLSRKYNIKLTSGNTLTAAVIIRSVEQIANRFGVFLDESSMAIIGASGDIGSGCTGYFCDKVKKLILTARGIEKLKEMKLKYENFIKCEIEIYNEKQNKRAIEQADIVIFVTSAYSEIVKLSDFRRKTIVCDASFPLNVRISGLLRPDVFIYHGGIVSLPFEIDPGVEAGLASKQNFYACQVEGIIIALKPDLPCSWGRGNISREKLQLYLNIFDSTKTMNTAYTVENKQYTETEMIQYSGRWAGS